MLRESLRGPAHAADKSTRLCSLEERDTLHTRPTPQRRGSPAPHRAGREPAAPAATLPGTGRLSGWDHRAAPVATPSGGQQPLRTLPQQLGLQGPGKHRRPAPPNRSPPRGKGESLLAEGSFQSRGDRGPPPPLKTGQHCDTRTARPGTRGPVNRDEPPKGPRGRAASVNVPFWDSCRCSFSW